MKFSEVLKKEILKNQTEIEQLKEKISGNCRELFEISYKEIFENNPDFNSFSWTQYTAYFNDGDPCSFSAHTDYIYIDDEDDETCFSNIETDFQELQDKDNVIKELEQQIKELQEKDSSSWQIKYKQDRIETLNNLNIVEVEKRYKFLKEINDLMTYMDQEVLESMFGDHVKVVVTIDGAETEDYEHD